MPVIHHRPTPQTTHNTQNVDPTIRTGLHLVMENLSNLIHAIPPPPTTLVCIHTTDDQVQVHTICTSPCFAATSPGRPSTSYTNDTTGPYNSSHTHCQHSIQQSHTTMHNPDTSLMAQILPTSWGRPLLHALLLHKAANSLQIALGCNKCVMIMSNASVSHKKIGTGVWIIQAEDKLWSGECLIPSLQADMNSGIAKVYRLYTALSFL